MTIANSQGLFTIGDSFDFPFFSFVFFLFAVLVSRTPITNDAAAAAAN